METAVAVVVACVALTVIAVGFYYLEKKEIEQGDQQPAGGTSDGEGSGENGGGGKNP